MLQMRNAPAEMPGRNDLTPHFTSPIPLRPYQKEMVAAIEGAAARGVQRPLAVLPTGGGKTIVFSHLVRGRGGRALILAHRDELITQARDKLTQVAPELADHIGIVKAGDDDHDRQIIVGSVQTLAQPARRQRIAKDFTTLVVDEAHHATADTYRAVLGDFGSFAEDGPLTVGVTATAGRADGVGLGHVWEEIAFSRGILEMIAEGYLVDVSALAVTSELDFGNVATRGGDFTDGSLGDELERSGAMEAAATAYARYAADRPGIAFTPTVATAVQLAAELCDRGITAEHVDGAMPRAERRAVLHRLHTGQTQVVANCAVLTEGFDEPKVSCVLMARPTKSVGFLTQMIGRGLRPHPGKQDCLVLDLAGVAATGLATLSDLAGLPPGSVKEGETLAEAAVRLQREQQRGQATVRGITAKRVDLFRRSALRWLPVDTAHILPAGRDLTIYLIPSADERWSVYEHARGRPATCTFSGLELHLAMGIGEEAARARGGVLSQNSAAWRDRTPSDAQMRTLRNLGYGPDALSQVTTSGQASDLLARSFAVQPVRRILAGAR